MRASFARKAASCVLRAVSSSGGTPPARSSRSIACAIFCASTSISMAACLSLMSFIAILCLAFSGNKPYRIVNNDSRFDLFGPRKLAYCVVKPCAPKNRWGWLSGRCSVRLVSGRRRRFKLRFCNGFYAASKRKEQDDSEGFESTLAVSTKNLGDRVEITIRDSSRLACGVSLRDPLALLGDDLAHLLDAFVAEEQ